MIARFFNHFVVPRVSLAAAKLSAKLRGQVAFRVLAQNMEPTLPQGSIVCYRPLGSTETLVRGSLVAFTTTEFEGHTVPTRVVALSGDTVAIEGGRLIVNGKPVAQPYVKVGFANADYSTQFPSQVLPEGTCFLLGDYRDASKDSRHLGPVPRAAILGSIARAGEA